MKQALLILALGFVLAPAVFLLTPRVAQANDYNGDWPQIISEVKNTLSAAADVLTSNSALSLQIKEYVLDPIAWAMSQQLLQQITGSVVGFVTGKGNGTGKPQFVQDLLGNLQGVGDNQMLAFVAQFGSNSNSPFASSITNALRTQYAQDSSLAGFFAANQCTLAQASPNAQAFLSGDWSQGGSAAWFSLVTQKQNNPYSLYNSASAKMSTFIADAKAARTADYQAGGGFISWCDTSASATQNVTSAQVGGGTVVAALPTLSQNKDGSYSSTEPQTCLNGDGTPGTIQTPGSVIKAQLDKSLGSGVDKLVSADEIDEIIGSLATQLVSSVLGGSSGGLFGVAQSSGGNRSLIDQYATSGVPNSTNTTTTSASSAMQLAQTALTNVNAYEAAWNTILASAQTTSSTLLSLQNGCTTQANAAQTALINEVQPIIDKAHAAISSAETTRTLANQTLTDAQSTAAGAAGQLLADTQELGAAPPTAADVNVAQSEAQTTPAPGIATAVPPGSLTVSGGTTVDQMNLITKNAQALSSMCFAPTTL